MIEIELIPENGIPVTVMSTYVPRIGDHVSFPEDDNFKDAERYIVRAITWFYDEQTSVQVFLK